MGGCHLWRRANHCTFTLTNSLASLPTGFAARQISVTVPSGFGVDDTCMVAGFHAARSVENCGGPSEIEGVAAVREGDGQITVRLAGDGEFLNGGA
jgi:hypothetical protein